VRSAGVTGVLIFSSGQLDDRTTCQHKTDIEKLAPECDLQLTARVALALSYRRQFTVVRINYTSKAISFNAPTVVASAVAKCYSVEHCGNRRTTADTDGV